MANVAGTVTVRPTMVGDFDIAGGIVATRDGKARWMYARVEVAPGVGETVTFTLIRIRGVTVSVSSLIAVIAGAATEAQNLTDSVPVLRGDTLQIRAVRSTEAAAPRRQRCGVNLA